MNPTPPTTAKPGKRTFPAAPAPFRIAAFLFFSLMLAASALPGKAHAVSALAGDKPAHFCAYGLLAALLYCGLAGLVRRRAAATLAMIGLLGTIDEGIQFLLPWRNADLADWMTNMVAALFSVALLALLNVRRFRRTNSGQRS